MSGNSPTESEIEYLHQTPGEADLARDDRGVRQNDFQTKMGLVECFMHIDLDIETESEAVGVLEETLSKKCFFRCCQINSIVT